MELEPTNELAEAANELIKTSNYLKAEMNHLVEPLRNSDDYIRDAMAVMTSYRLIIRAQISHIEAICHLMKRMVLSISDSKLSGEFEQREILQLQNMKKDRKDPSKLISFYPESKSNLNFSFNSYARVFAPTFILQNEGRGWQDYLTLLQVRNRMTHPKDLNSQIGEWPGE